MEAGLGVEIQKIKGSDFTFGYQGRRKKNEVNDRGQNELYEVNRLGECASECVREGVSD